VKTHALVIPAAQVLINADTAEVGTGRNLSDFPTYRAQALYFARCYPLGEKLCPTFPRLE